MRNFFVVMLFLCHLSLAKFCNNLYVGFVVFCFFFSGGGGGDHAFTNIIINCCYHRLHPSMIGLFLLLSTCSKELNRFSC